MKSWAPGLKVRATLYEKLAYLGNRAQDALDRGDFAAHAEWAAQYHRLLALLEG